MIITYQIKLDEIPPPLPRFMPLLQRLLFTIPPAHFYAPFAMPPPPKVNVEKAHPQFSTLTIGGRGGGFVQGEFPMSSKFEVLADGINSCNNSMGSKRSHSFVAECQQTA